MLTITLDENIPYAAEAFNTLGQTRLVAGRVMCNADLQDTDIYRRQLKIRFSYFDNPKIIGHQCA